jgi:hypothetical protein
LGLESDFDSDDSIKDKDFLMSYDKVRLYSSDEVDDSWDENEAFESE